MSWSWARERAFSSEEAARLLDIPFASVRTLLSAGGTNFVSAKIGSQRLLSAEDIAILAVARVLVGTGFTTETAFSEASRHLSGQIEQIAASGDMLLASPSGGAPPGSTIAIALNDIPVTPKPAGTVLVLAGKVVAETIAAARAAY